MTDRVTSKRPEGGHTAELATSAPRTTATPSWVQMSTTPLQAALRGVEQSHIGPATTVWPTGQDSDVIQRAGRYLPETLRHPQRTLPALAAQAISRYTHHGQTVFAPFVGCGTIMVEAVPAGRRAAGADIDRRWVDLAMRNVMFAHQNGATAEAVVGHKDARDLGAVPRRLRGSVDLVVATPPARLHPLGHSARQSSNADLVGRLEIDLKLSLHAWLPLLHPGTTILFTARLLHRAHQTLDLTIPIAYAAAWARLDFVERVAALRVPLRDAQLRQPHACRRRGLRPRVVHDDVLVFRVPDAPPRGWRRRR